ncbi:hypothetical protein ARMGADRAFT_1093560 [Armillaria gallica]|uniref:Peptidase C14 n=1 Tax=Armillaria gallica TaxID=47427 RepID=A0A2H3CUK5_ARMGA|nr:hypothetical protein ARMGADRAFT_1093560 [Armillaria gallica]
MEDYLTNALGIPENRIQRLLCPTPNSNIQNGNNIIIYLSGHGSSYTCEHHTCAPDDVCGVEALCPSDRGTRDTNNNVITDITDRELNAILTQICRAKGRKITVILDCCYSSGLTRSPSTTGVCSVPELE